MPGDAITMLKDDHKKVKKLFKEFDKVKESERPDRIGSIVETICHELLTHAQLEEQIFYPMARETVKDEMDVLEAFEEHHVVEGLINELLGMDPSDERYVPKAIVLTELVKHHVEEEEGEMFPEIRDAVGRKALQEIGERMLERKTELQKETRRAGAA